MAFALTQIVASTDTFGTWLNLTNQMANLITNDVVTANNEANGAITSGNAYFTGIFSANVLAVPAQIRGGNVQSTNTLYFVSNADFATGNVISIGNSTVNAVFAETGVTLSNSTVTFTITKPTAAQYAANVTFLHANGSYVDLDTAESTTTTGTSAQMVDTWNAADFYSMEYTITVNDNNANNRMLAKVLVLQDEGSVYLNEYAIVESNTAMGSFSANVDTGAIRVYYTPVSSNTTVLIRGEGIKK